MIRIISMSPAFTLMTQANMRIVLGIRQSGPHPSEVNVCACTSCSRKYRYRKKSKLVLATVIWVKSTLVGSFINYSVSAQ